MTQSQYSRVRLSPPILKGLFPNSPTGHTEYDADLEYLVVSVLDQIGIPAHLSGYEYLKYVFMESVNNPEICASITKIVYPKVAECYGTTPSRVERAIRHAIERATDYGDPEIMNKWIGNGVSPDKGKPTNTQFIRAISNKLRLHIRLEAKARATTIN